MGSPGSVTLAKNLIGVSVRTDVDTVAPDEIPV
jgi:hypothetical protein